MKVAIADELALAIRSGLQAILQKVGLVTPYDLQHILEQNNIDLEGKEKRKMLEELSDLTNSKLVYGNIEWDSILYPYVLTQEIFEFVQSALQELIVRFKQRFSVSRKEMCSILIGVLILSFKKQLGNGEDTERF
ncbi:MAG: hypothetical protein ACFFCD_04340 [Promethearchaeota archaeon]